MSPTRTETPHRIAFALALASALLVGKQASAAADLIGTRATGMAGAHRASASGTSAVLLNPAGMSLARQYLVGALYQFRSADTASQVNASVVDSVTSRIAAGLVYNFVYASPDRLLVRSDSTADLGETEQTHEVALSLSTALGSWVLLGVTGKYLNHSTSLSDDAPEDLTTASISNITLDVGGIVRLGQNFRAAVVGYNLIPVDDGLYPQALGVGGAFELSGGFTAAFDTVVDFTSDPGGASVTLHGGLESFFSGKYALRAGVEHNTYRDATHVAVGAGIITRALGFDLAVRQQVDGGKSTLVSADFQFFVK